MFPSGLVSSLVEQLGLSRSKVARVGSVSPVMVEVGFTSPPLTLLSLRTTLSVDYAALQSALGFVTLHLVVSCK